MKQKNEFVPVLQNRWKLEGNTLSYYGLRQPPHTFNRKIRLTRREKAVLSLLDGKRALCDIPHLGVLKKFARLGIVVDVKKRRKTPESFMRAAFCTNCCANDFMIPGLEFDENGLCPMCRDRSSERLRSILPMLKTVPKAKEGEYDVALFYTGGKDSSFLLYYLAKVCGLRVLSLTWEIPFLSDNARQSIENAKLALPNAEFIVRPAPPESLGKVYRTLFSLQQNTCACPTLAYALFYPLLVEKRVPVLLLGNEPVQVKNLLYNGMAPKITFYPAATRLALLFVNIGRALTLKRSLRNGQFQLLMTVRQLLYGESRLQRLVGYQNELLENIHRALAKAPELLKDMEKAYRVSNRNGRLPRLMHLDFDALSEGGVYDWNGVKELLQKEIGWVGPPQDAKGLHTSCKIERCKEHSQFIRFYNMESAMIPFSALELSLAVRDGNLSREQAMEELSLHSGFSLTPPKETALMKAAFIE